MTTAQPLRLAVISSSTREGRFAPTVSSWFMETAAAHQGFTLDLIDLADHELPSILSHSPSPETQAALAAVSPRLEEADAYVVLTPEYNHSYPASVKTLIDWHYTQWRAKPVGFVSYGGMAGGSRAVEHLRPVFAELHAVTVRDTVALASVWDQFDEEGKLRTEGPAGAVKAMLDQLAWWGEALREARAARPYGA